MGGAPRLLTIMITVMLCVGTLVPFGAAQPAIPPLTVRGDLLAIKGDTYVVRVSFPLFFVIQRVGFHATGFSSC
jgi:hypothetical protein